MKRFARNTTELLRHVLAGALAVLLALGPAPRVLADVVTADPRVVQRSGTPPGAKIWDVTFQNGAIIRYSSFDVMQQQTANFIPLNGDANARVLNRINSARPTTIDGAITGSGRIYIVNPAGVFFGADAQINVTALQAAAGNLSDRDFKAGRDHFTNLKGPVENAGDITANAVALVGRNVINSGDISSDGWIIMAAGRDVFIGRDPDGNGLLLRVEGGADAVFDKKAIGVTNTGDLNVEAVPAGQTDPVPAGRISLGAGDLYGTAIFNTGAIKAREIAMQANNKGDVALAGNVSAGTLGITFGGDQNGKLVGAGGSGEHTLNADTLNLRATGAKGQVVVADPFALRSANGAGPASNLNVEQKATLTASNLSKLGLGSPDDRAQTEVALTSATGIDLNDKTLVGGTRLTLDAPAVKISGANDPLVVDRLNLQARLTQSESDLIATGTDKPVEVDATEDTPAHTEWEAALRIGGNLQMDTKTGAAGGPTAGGLIRAANGTVASVGDIVTSDGGGLRIEGGDVTLGTLSTDGTDLNGGSILSSGSRVSRVTITADNTGKDAHLTGSVQAKSIITSAAVTQPGIPQTEGGDVVVTGTGDVHLYGDILTAGGAGAHQGDPRRNGGSVHLSAGQTLTVANITTGGADHPADPAPGQPVVEHGDIRLTGSEIVVNGNISARAGSVNNSAGERDRSVVLDGPVTLNTDTINIGGGPVMVTGHIQEGTKPSDPNDPNSVPITRDVTLSFDSGALTLGGGADVNVLRVVTLGPESSLTLGGDVTARDFIDVSFGTNDVATWTTTGPSVTVHSPSIAVGNDPNGTTGGVALGPNLKFDLLQPAPPDPSDPNATAARPSFSFSQNRAIDQDTIAQVFTPDRFTTGVAEKSISLNTTSAMTFSQDSADALAGSDLDLLAARFVAAPPAGQRLSFDVDSFRLTTLGALDADLNVIAAGTADDQGIGLQSGASPGGPGNLSVKGSYQSRAILLVAGDGRTEAGRTDANILIDPTATFASADGTSHPEIFGLSQDADLVSTSLPKASQFGGGSVAGMEMRLESSDGGVRLDDTQSGLYTGTKLVIDGTTGIDLGNSALDLAGLIARSRTDLVVSHDVTVSQAGGAIDLIAGNGTGTGNLTVAAKLTADDIELRAGSGASGATSSRVILGSGAKFAGDSQANPERFAMVQDASLVGDPNALGGGDLPSTSDFADPNLAGMNLVLRSLGGSLTLADTSLVKDTALELEGKTGIDVQLKGGPALTLASLGATGPTTLDGSVTTTGDLKVDGTLTLSAPAVGTTPADQQLLAGGALTVTGKTSKTTDGSVLIGSSGAPVGGDVTIGDVATAHTGGQIQVYGSGAVTTGTLDASGTRPAVPAGQPQAVAVRVSGAGAVDVAGIDASGQTGSRAKDGGDAGSVEVSGDSLRLGTINASGGAGGTSSANQDRTHGGNAGSILLTATGADHAIGILGDLLAVGGEGARQDTNTPADPLRGAANDVTVNGSLLLLANDSLVGFENTIRGQNVSIAGNIAPGMETLDGATEPTPIPASATGLTVAAKGTLAVGGDTLNAGHLDLEAQQGGLNLAGKTIYADVIRLAASDGAGGSTAGVVDISGTTFMGSDKTRRIVSLTLEQDKGFGGPDGSAIPNVNGFAGSSADDEMARSLGLISQDGRVILDSADFAKVQGTRLLLASNAVTAAGVSPIEVDGNGEELDLQSLQLGSVLGVVGAGGTNEVGGNTIVNGDLRLTGLGLDDEALRAYGNVTVNGDAHVIGRGTFAGDGDQTLAVSGGLELGGSLLGKNTNGSFTIEAQHIDLTSPTAQTISNDSGQLVIGGPLVKGDFNDADGDGNLDPNTPPLIDPNHPDLGLQVGQRSLSLLGLSTDANQPAVKVSGTKEIVPGTGAYAIAVANGDLLISAVTRAPGASDTTVGRYELDGDVLAFGDVTLAGEGTFAGHQPTYTISALHNPFELAAVGSGELTMGGVASADGNLRLVASGIDPTEDDQHPSAIHLQGNFAGLTGGLELDGSVDFKNDTTIAAAGNVTFDSEIQGDKSLTVTSGGQISLGDDVSMTAGALSLAGDGGVHFDSTNDTQFIRADSLTFGKNATPTKSGAATLVRNGSLSLAANKGSVTMASGQRMVVNGSLSVSAPKTIVLDDTAALKISLVSHDLTVRSGATVMGNSIVSSASPVVTSSGLATFATPTRTEVSDSIPGENILLRQINSDGSKLSLDAAFAGDEVFFPPVTGPAQFDYAADLPRPPLRYPITRPAVDVWELDAALENRPLWAEELLAYLQQRSLETPGVSESVEHLPPVGARPGDPLVPADRRVRSAAAEQAVALYREVFRPNVARDPETGFVEGPGKAAAIRAAFQAPVDQLRHGARGQPITGGALRELIEANPDYAAASSYRSQLDQLLAAGELALNPEQKPRFRALLLSAVTPYGIAPAEFATAIQ